MANIELSFEVTHEMLASSTIVIVDDEELVTTSLRNLLFLDLDAEAVTFNDPTKAIAYLSENTPDLIISDFLMPEVDGIQLLGHARERQPEVPRVLLTGYADKENAIKAINQVQLFQYVEKPWDNEQLRNVIKNGLERRHLIKQLYSFVDKLAKTEKDLQRLRKGLVRAFA